MVRRLIVNVLKSSGFVRCSNLDKVLAHSNSFSGNARVMWKVKKYLHGMSRFLDAKISTLPRQWSYFENHNNPFMIISLTCVYDIARTLHLIQIYRSWRLQPVEFHQVRRRVIFPTRIKNGRILL